MMCAVRTLDKSNACPKNHMEHRKVIGGAEFPFDSDHGILEFTRLWVFHSRNAKVSTMR